MQNFFYQMIKFFSWGNSILGCSYYFNPQNRDIFLHFCKFKNQRIDYIYHFALLKKHERINRWRIHHCVWHFVDNKVFKEDLRHSNDIETFVSAQAAMDIEVLICTAKYKNIPSIISYLKAALQDLQKKYPLPKITPPRKQIELALRSSDKPKQELIFCWEMAEGKYFKVFLDSNQSIILQFSPNKLKYACEIVYSLENNLGYWTIYERRYIRNAFGLIQIERNASRLRVNKIELMELIAKRLLEKFIYLEKDNLFQEGLSVAIKSNLFTAKT